MSQLPETSSNAAWHARTQRWILTLNDKKNAPIVEVGPDGTFGGGDLGTSKGPADKFEAEITGAKPGVRLMSVEDTQSDASDEDDDLEEHQRHEETQTLRFLWVGEGTVDYEALPPLSSVRAPAAETDTGTGWTVVGGFSVDSGMVCLFSKHALDSVLASGTGDREEMLEAFIDDDDAGHVFVPSGIVVSGNDGGYEILGRYDADDGKLVRLKVQEAYAS